MSLKSGVRSSWKSEAKKKIKAAQLIIVVLGKDTNDSQKEKTMGWEVEKAVRYNKQIVIYNTGKYALPKFMYRKNQFTSLDQPIAKQMSLEEIKKRIDDYENGYYDIFSSDYSQLPPDQKPVHDHELIEQYKMFQKSSEDLVSRRQSVNSFYITVNSAIVALTGVVMGLIEMPVKLLVALFMCLSGSILAISWMKILEAYGTLNAAKMKVICLIEKKLPVALYDVEWQVMSDKLNNKKYVSFTKREKRIPVIFLILYAIVIAFVLVFLLIRWLT